MKHNPPLILVADDVLPTTIMLERVFEYEGYQVKSVYDGIAAMQAARDMLPDLILLDINMPGMNGFEVLSQLREDTRTSSIPTILITAMGDVSDVVQGLNLGADDYLRKPFHPQEVLARAQSKMKARQLEESLQRRTQELEVLLRANEALSQNIELDQLLKFVLYLVIDMVTCRKAAIYHLDDDGILEDLYVLNKDGTVVDDFEDSSTIIAGVLDTGTSLLWSDAASPMPDHPHGIAIPLRYSDKMLGVIIVAGDYPYDLGDLRLLEGISRSAALAVRNAELYEIQANYAQHLEDMVAARTRELESAQQMLVRSEKLASVGRLAASVAHEIKNPLFPIRINLENMVEDIEANIAISVMDIERTLESVERIQSIVDRLLGFTGNWQTSNSDKQAIDVNKVIQDIASLNFKYFQQENITIELNLAPLPLIQGYKFQLEHVFMNLSLNAKDAMPHGGTIRFTSWMERNHLMITVEDNGCGIPADLIDRIFEPFVSTKENGNGLGLFISYGIIEKHYGLITVESEVNQGTRFTIKLPA